MQRAFTTILLLITLLCIAEIPAQTAEADDQRALVQKFITAYFVKDMAVARTCMPKNNALLFTQYPFTAAPTLSQPKVRKGQALMEFSGPVADGQMIGKGGILFSRHGNLWQVRQIMFYDKVPRIFNLPTRSVTAADRGQEATVKTLGEKFVAQWKANNVKGMLGLWYNWVKDTPEKIKGLSMTNFKAENKKTRWNDPYITYTVDLAYRLGPVSYKMTAHGGVVLVKEGGEWKVRANSFILNF